VARRSHTRAAMLPLLPSRSPSLQSRSPPPSRPASSLTTSSASTPMTKTLSLTKSSSSHSTSRTSSHPYANMSSATLRTIPCNDEFATSAAAAQSHAVCGPRDMFSMYVWLQHDAPPHAASDSFEAATWTGAYITEADANSDTGSDDDDVRKVFVAKKDSRPSRTSAAPPSSPFLTATSPAPATTSSASPTAVPRTTYYRHRAEDHL
jgi:hypothetical protein